MWKCPPNRSRPEPVRLSLNRSRSREATAYPQRPDGGPNPNPVTLGAAEKPLDENGKLDPTRIASAEDFGDWDDLSCQG